VKTANNKNWITGLTGKKANNAKGSDILRSPQY
jgi:hypothetical protein